MTRTSRAGNPVASGLLKADESCRAQLLVSVRNVTEALAALEGGCDVLDIKEPLRGPLGMADALVIEEIARTVRERSPETVISAALGEVIDWSDVEVPPLPAELAIAKLGLAHLAGRSDWRRQWCEVREKFDASSRGAIGWVAVAYADWKSAGSPPPVAILDMALECDCVGLLIDTYAKTGQGLFHWLSVAELRTLSRRARENGFFLALAGKLALGDLPDLRQVDPEVIAIRSAACAGGDRQDKIDAEAVRRFKSACQSR